jgi:transcriptional regulator with XRE-family HTH domain
MAQVIRAKRLWHGPAAKRIRQLQNIKQDTVAQASGIHPAYLSNIEKGAKQPSLELMGKLANALNVGIDEVSYVTNVVILADEVAA